MEKDKGSKGIEKGGEKGSEEAGKESKVNDKGYDGQKSRIDVDTIEEHLDSSLQTVEAIAGESWAELSHGHN